MALTACGYSITEQELFNRFARLMDFLAVTPLYLFHIRWAGTPDFGHSSVVKAITPDLSGGRTDNPTSVFVSPEIDEEVQAALFEVLGNPIRVQTKRPRFTRPPNRSEGGGRTLKRHTSI
jgi:hypothetical protein